ncbi:hypothetical protein [Cellulomonas xiejunii]|uniref:Uncharacterized protein n=1 Tax=Cellulomonas xiejunii TaxID=2968083 RepID=A0ABY5KTZ9_9CELL|nr:hypothetical protein [Cellulomonas xiejunii]MCC2321226.1 hypothetical protein [Cellulomonas xiejunii]UUI71813.1 hypothetical protein NP048_18835 [Cellulomonas xiejunii]
MTAPTAVEVVANAQVHAGPDLTPLVGFMASDFAPLVYAAVRECVGDPRGSHLLEGVGDRVAIVLGSRRFDTVSLDLSVEQVDQGRVSPILFYQVVPTAVLGQVARDYGLTGPVSCLAVTDDARAEVREVADVLLADGDVDWVLAVTVEMAPDPTPSSAGAELVRWPNDRKA